MNKFSHLERGEESCGGKGRKIYPDGFDGSLRFFPLPLFWSFGSWLVRRVVERRRGGGEILCVNYEEGIWFGRVLLFRLNLGICEQVKRRELKFSNLYIF